MIKYPLYVTLDTNIFDANKLDFSKESTLGLVKQLVTHSSRSQRNLSRRL